MHSAVGIDTANKKLDDTHGKLQSIERKLEMMMVFRKLDTPREKDVRKFIDDNGGAKACVTNDELLEELVTRSGETAMVASHAGPGRGGGGRDVGRRANESLPDVKKRLLKELQEDIDEAFSRNMVLFERKLDVQSKQLAETMKEESENVVRALLAGAHDRITDPVCSESTLSAAVGPNRKLAVGPSKDLEGYGLERERQSASFRASSPRLLHRSTVTWLFLALFFFTYPGEHRYHIWSSVPQHAWL